jgi:hypothetical protein
MMRVPKWLEPVETSTGSGQLTSNGMPALRIATALRYLPFPLLTQIWYSRKSCSCDSFGTRPLMNSLKAAS